VIECDGSQHFTDEGLKADRIRDATLGELERRVLRLDNRQILLEMDGVVQLIMAIIKD
jgi:very-short-patch-repair endonuclease